MACQNVMVTGLVAAASASTGQGASCSWGIVVVVATVVDAPPESGGTVGTVTPPLSRIERPLPQPTRVAPTMATTRARPPATRRWRRHPLTAPAVSPRISWRWKMMSTITIGTEAITVPAVMRLRWSGLALDSDRSPIWTVR